MISVRYMNLKEEGDRGREEEEKDDDGTRTRTRGQLSVGALCRAHTVSLSLKHHHSFSWPESQQHRCASEGLSQSEFRFLDFPTPTWLTRYFPTTPFQQMGLFFQHLLQLDGFKQACSRGFNEVYFAHWYYWNCSKTQNQIWKWDSILQTLRQDAWYWCKQCF